MIKFWICFNCVHVWCVFFILISNAVFFFLLVIQLPNDSFDSKLHLLIGSKSNKLKKNFIHGFNPPFSIPPYNHFLYPLFRLKSTSKLLKSSSKTHKLALSSKKSKLLNKIALTYIHRGYLYLLGRLSLKTKQPLCSFLALYDVITYYSKTYVISCQNCFSFLVQWQTSPDSDLVSKDSGAAAHVSSLFEQVLIQMNQIFFFTEIIGMMYEIRI